MPRLGCDGECGRAEVPIKAYLDIETCASGDVTVLGIFREDRGFVQLVGGQITDVTVCDALKGVDTICTFNGDRFDLPTLERHVRVDLRSRFKSLDLLTACRRAGLKGGLKRLEERFGIARTTRGLNGFDALRLWARYQDERDEAALELLLAYNREDVLNLLHLERLVIGVGLVESGEGGGTIAAAPSVESQSVLPGLAPEQPANG